MFELLSILEFKELFLVKELRIFFFETRVPKLGKKSAMIFLIVVHLFANHLRNSRV